MKGVFQQLFAPWIYKVSISKEDSQKLFDYYVPEITKEAPTLPLPKGWQCRVYTSFENADNIMRGGVLLACHHGLTDDMINHMHNVIEQFIKKY